MLLWCEVWEQLNPALSKHFLCYLDKPELSETLRHFSKLGNTMFLWRLCVGLQTSLEVASILERCLPPSCDFTLQTATVPWAGRLQLPLGFTPASAFQLPAGLPHPQAKIWTQIPNLYTWTMEKFPTQHHTYTRRCVWMSASITPPHTYKNHFVATHPDREGIGS